MGGRKSDLSLEMEATVGPQQWTVRSGETRGLTRVLNTSGHHYPVSAVIGVFTKWIIQFENRRGCSDLPSAKLCLRGDSITGWRWGWVALRSSDFFTDYTRQITSETRQRCSPQEALALALLGQPRPAHLCFSG